MSSGGGLQNSSSPRVITKQSLADLDQAISAFVQKQLVEGIELRDSSTLVVSGGSTPRGFFQQLGTVDLPWSSIRVTLADERWVAKDHPDSNEGQLRKWLPKVAEAELISLRGDRDDPCVQIENLNETLGNEQALDVVVLGMGADGHTASLFPDAPQLKEGLNLANPAACLLVDPPAAPHRRVSLTLSKLLQAREIIVHITGEEKVSVIENAWRVADPERFPISAVLHQSLVPVTIFSDRAITLG